MRPADLLLALDTGSPTVSVAVGRGGEVVAERSVEIGRSSARLLALIDEVLGEAGLDGPRGLAGIVALAGPGSFTGLRVGLATALGLHQATGVPATTIPTLEVLAAAVPAGRDEEVRLAVVDVLRDEWAVEEFAPGHDGAPPRSLGAASRRPTVELLAACAGRRAGVVGFGATRLAERAATGGAPSEPRCLEPPPLAAVALRLAALVPPSWEPGSLTRPIYFRPPAVTLPPSPASR